MSEYDRPWSAPEPLWESQKHANFSLSLAHFSRSQTTNKKLWTSPNNIIIIEIRWSLLGNGIFERWNRISREDSELFSLFSFLMMPCGGLEKMIEINFFVVSRRNFSTSKSSWETQVELRSTNLIIFLRQSARYTTPPSPSIFNVRRDRSWWTSSLFAIISDYSCSSPALAVNKLSEEEKSNKQLQLYWFFFASTTLARCNNTIV